VVNRADRTVGDELRAGLANPDTPEARAGPRVEDQSARDGPALLFHQQQLAIGEPRFHSLVGHDHRAGAMGLVDIGHVHVMVEVVERRQVAGDFEGQAAAAHAAQVGPDGLGPQDLPGHRNI
jgi:hypothetical protein